MKTRAKTALINGNVRPMDEACSTTEAVLICGSIIEATGTTAEILALAGENPTIIDLAGDTLMPGFIDTHSHVSLYATLSEKVYCGIDAGTLDGVLARIKAYADTLEKGDWVIGWGFDDTGLPEMRGPEILKALRGNGVDKVPNSRIMVMTNFDQDTESRVAMQHDVDAYLIKAEITPRRLIEIIRGFETPKTT